MKPVNLQEQFVKIFRKVVRSGMQFQGVADEKCQNELGFVLSYYLKEILKEQKDPNIIGKWIDFVEWESLHLIKSNLVKGTGKLWWGLRKDTSKTFSGDFYCELEIEEANRKAHVLYFFRFQINGANYELKN